ncbi:MAG TPA: type II toxin-antitoxin system RelB/DinJ family antitoxin [Balneolaceae bacterium]|nr:type II toxin-antitoxin system RelB/DinJ family antitoxin [Balneolaceae bacterium]
MSAKSATVRARLEPGLKKEAEQILDELGINTTEAIRIFFKQVKLHKGLPFDLKIPNDVTHQTIQDANSRKDLKEFESADDLFEDLDI